MEGSLLSAAVACGIMGGLGLFFGAVLALAHRFLKVEEDPRLDELEVRLPGSNCGACGEAGCRAFAEALLEQRAAPAACTVSSPAEIDGIAALLGVDAGEQVPRVARLACAGGRAQARTMAEYQGLSRCAEAALVGAAGKACSWGCVGLADCEVACGFDAISMNEGGLPVVDPALCTACGDCVTACPRDLFQILPLTHRLLVQCRVPLAGEVATALCSVACDACGRCARDAAPGLIRMVDNLPVIDLSAGGPATPEATRRCPTGAIRWVEGAQFAEQAPLSVPGIASPGRSDVSMD